MNFVSPKPEKKIKQAGSFTRQKRFLQYGIAANRTSNFLGPGSYNNHIDRLKFLDKPCCVTFVIIFVIFLLK